MSHRPSPEAGACWRLRTGARLRWRRWGDEHVVFDAATAATHLLPGAAAAILHRLERGPAHTAALATAVYQDASGGDDALHTLLATLRRLDLIEQVAP